MLLLVNTQQQCYILLFCIDGGGMAVNLLIWITTYHDVPFFVIFQDPLAGRSIFSGNLFQYLEENRKWRNRFISVPNSYTISFYESKTVRRPSNVIITWYAICEPGCKNRLDSLWSLSQAHERGLHPKGTINCAGYKALTSLEEYMELINASLPGRKWTCRAIWAKNNSEFLQAFYLRVHFFATQFIDFAD